MALSLAKTLRSIVSKAPRHVSRVQGTKHSGKRQRYIPYVNRACMRPYGTSAYKMISKVPAWFFASIAGAMAGALAGTAFWSAYTSRKNDIESLKEDLKALPNAIEIVDEDKVLEIALKMSTTVRSLPDSEILRAPHLVADILVYLAGYYAGIGYARGAERIIELLYSITGRIDAENKYPSILVSAYHCDYDYQLRRKRYPEAKELLLKELDLTRTAEQIDASLRQTATLQSLAGVSVLLGELSQTSKYLEEAHKLFYSVTVETLTPEIEKNWIDSIAKQLEYAYVCEQEGNNDTATLFKVSSKNLHDAYTTLKPNGIPNYEQMESYYQWAATIELHRKTNSTVVWMDDSWFLSKD